MKLYIMQFSPISTFMKIPHKHTRLYFNIPVFRKQKGE